ncbi:MAG: hypothetical protein HUK07_05255 [Bacteroidaceae bacterium]|nr:hypothetical protein [Bacteroidaceae bacterium]
MRTFGQNFIITGKVDNRLGAFLTKLMQLRMRADYNCSFQVSEDDIKLLAADAEAFVETIDKML